MEYEFVLRALFRVWGRFKVAFERYEILDYALENVQRFEFWFSEEEVFRFRQILSNY